jgi:hypothetical protein
MPSVRFDDSPSIRPPKCPACKKPMRLESAVPDIHFSNLDHFLFKCDCGWDSDQLIFCLDSAGEADERAEDVLDAGRRKRALSPPTGESMRLHGPEQDLGGIYVWGLTVGGIAVVAIFGWFVLTIFN